MHGIIAGSLIGLAFGFLIGAIKYFLLWRPVINIPPGSPAKASPFILSFIIRYILSFLIDVLSLFLIYLFRNYLAWNYIFLLAGTAVSLSIVGLFFAAKATKPAPQPQAAGKENLFDHHTEA